MAKPQEIELPGGELMPILYEDSSVLAVDKPIGWLLVPEQWRQTSRNLQLALRTGLRERAFWARSRNLRFLRYVHRLDAETSGVLLLAKSAGALAALSALFERREIEKVYLAVVAGRPKLEQWTCRLKLAPDPCDRARVIVSLGEGVESETEFRVVQGQPGRSLIEARPKTGRTHQIRVHLASAGYPVLGDPIYGGTSPGGTPLALRAIALTYFDPFRRHRVRIYARVERFLQRYGFEPRVWRGLE